jgi:CheY-like chemotaxis protein
MSAPLNVLIVDDSAVIRGVLTKILAGEGMQVIAA